MADLKDTGEIKGLMSAVKDIMMKNQNLYQQDLQRQYGFQQPEEPVDEISGSDSEGLFKVFWYLGAEEFDFTLGSFSRPKQHANGCGLAGPVGT